MTRRKGMEAGRELDALVAERVMGWKVHPYNTAHYMRAEDGVMDYRPMCWVSDWQPSRNMAQAWQVALVLRERWGMFALVAGLSWHCFPFDEMKHYGWGTADTAPLAICRAALAAIDATPATPTGRGRAEA